MLLSQRLSDSPCDPGEDEVDKAAALLEIAAKLDASCQQKLDALTAQVLQVKSLLLQSAST